MSRPMADVCLVGVGAVGGILAKELASAGLKVVGFERGPAPRLADYAPRDSIKFIARVDRLDWVRHEPTTSRSKAGETAELRYRTSPLNVLGGALLHWTGQASRYMPGDFKVYTNEILSGNAERAGADLRGYDVVDWPLGYDDLEPYYEKFEWEFGVSGEAGKNPFAGPRKRGYPVPPLRHSARMKLFAEACEKLGYHPYDTPAGILSEPYRPAAPYDTRIAERPACVISGTVIFTAATFTPRRRRFTPPSPSRSRRETSICGRILKSFASTWTTPGARPASPISIPTAGRRSSAPGSSS